MAVVGALLSTCVIHKYPAHGHNTVNTYGHLLGLPEVAADMNEMFVSHRPQ